MPARILLVEPHIRFREFLSAWLTRDGHVVVGVGSAQEAKARSAPGAFALVIAEQGLPDGSGLGLLEELGRASAAPSGILLTGRGETGLVDATPAGGADMQCFAKAEIYLKRLRLAVDEALACRAGVIQTP